MKTIEYSYKNAPYFHNVYSLIQELFSESPLQISKLAGRSIELCCKYLKLKKEFKYSSEQPYGKDLTHKKSDRLIAIAKQEKAKNYVNPIGGRKLYDKSYFSQHNIKLSFLSSNIGHYEQCNTKEFIDGLSIIDVMMNCSPEKISEMAKQGNLI